MNLRSGKILEQPQRINMSIQNKPDLPDAKEDLKERNEPIFLAPVIRVPYPSALDISLPSDKIGVKMNEMPELFKQVQINLLLLNAIKQVPTYAKFLEDLCTRNHRSQAHIPKKVYY